MRQCNQVSYAMLACGRCCVIRHYNRTGSILVMCSEGLTARQVPLQDLQKPPLLMNLFQRWCTNFR